MSGSPPGAKPPNDAPFDGTMELTAEAVFEAARAAMPFQKGKAPPPSATSESPFEKTMVLTGEPDRPSWEGTLDLSAARPRVETVPLPQNIPGLDAIHNDAPALPFRQNTAALEEKFGGTMDLTDADIVVAEEPSTARMGPGQGAGAVETPFAIPPPNSSPAPSEPIPGAPWASVPVPKAPAPKVDLEQTLAIEEGHRAPDKPIRPILVLGTHPHEPPVEEPPPASALIEASRDLPKEPPPVEEPAPRGMDPRWAESPAAVTEAPNPPAAPVKEPLRSEDVWAKPMTEEPSSAPKAPKAPTAPERPPPAPDRTAALYAKFRSPKQR